MKGTPKRAERGAKKSVDTVEFDLEERPSPMAPPKEAPASLEDIREEAETAQPKAQGSLGSGKQLVAKKAEEVIEEWFTSRSGAAEAPPCRRRSEAVGSPPPPFPPGTPTPTRPGPRPSLSRRSASTSSRRAVRKATTVRRARPAPAGRPRRARATAHATAMAPARARASASATPATRERRAAAARRATFASREGRASSATRRAPPAPRARPATAARCACRPMGEGGRAPRASRLVVPGLVGGKGSGRACRKPSLFLAHPLSRSLSGFRLLAPVLVPRRLPPGRHHLRGH